MMAVGTGGRRLSVVLVPLALLLAAAAGGSLWVASLGGAYVAAGAPAPTAAAERAEPASDEQLERLRRKLAAQRPGGIWVEIDTFGNRLLVRKGDEVLREAVCSTGSGTVLRDPRDGRLWVFDSPLGERRVQRKVKDPVWIKPDWAFVEEGRLPPESFRDRVDDISLGEYGLYLGDGYIIHGTLFQTLLGRGVTHGCIRLGDADLEYVYKTVPVGARVLLH